MDQLIILLVVISAVSAAAIAVIGPFLGLAITVIRYLQKLWWGPVEER